MRKRLAGALLFLVGLSSCGTVQVKPVKNPIVVPQKKEIKPVTVMPGRVFIKRDYLVKEPADVVLAVNFNGGTLKDFADYLSRKGITVYYDPILSARIVSPIRGKFSLKELLDRVAFESNCYWQAKGRLVEFDKDKIVTYQFPLFSTGYLEAVYGFDGNDNLLKAFKESFFKTLETNLKDVLEYGVSGKVEVVQNEEWNEQNQVTTKKEKSLNSSYEKENVKGNTAKSTVREESKVSSKNSTNRENLNGSNYDTGKRVRKGESLLRLNKKKSQEVTNRAETTTEHSKEGESVSSAGENTNSKIVKNRLKNRVSLGENTEKENVLRTLRAVYGDSSKGKVFVVPSLGELIVRVTPSEEKRVDEMVRGISREVLGSMVSLKVYVVEMTRSSGKDYSLFVKALKRAYRHEATFEIGNNNQVNVNFTNLSTNYLSGIAHGIDITSVLNYIVSTGQGKLVSSSTLLTLPRIPARISSVVKIPFAVPTSISQGGTNPTLTYDVKSVDDGFKIRIVPTVLDDKTIVMGIGLMENRYLGDKEVRAGNVGTITLPVQSPRELGTVVRCNPGDVIFIGGIRKYAENLKDATNLGIPYEKKSDREYSELYILIEPRLIIFKGGETR